MKKILKYIFMFSIGLLVTETCFSAPPVGGTEYGLVVNIAPYVNFKVSWPDVDFAYYQYGSHTNKDWDPNTISILSNAGWSFDILADENLLRHPTVSNTVDISIHKVSMQQMALDGFTTIGSVKFLSSTVPIGVIDNGDKDFILDWNMDMSTLGYLPAGRYSTGMTYSVSLTP